jgi:antitoxin CptB
MPNPSPQMSSTEYSLLKWRSRRGLLENDILLERFFDKHPTLTEEEGLAITHILNLTDRVLMDLLMNKAEIPDELKASHTLDMSDSAADQSSLTDNQSIQFQVLPEVDQAMQEIIEKMIKRLQNI